MNSSAAPPADHVLALPLTGVRLIEASAGTGKTWTIANLFLRLVAEAGLTCPQVLVVTFTEAATAELRERIRGRLAQAHAALCGGPCEDPTIQALCARLPDPRTAAARLRDAIRGFEDAAIHTIHGFCGRVLADAAFETGAAFEADLVGDDADLLAQIGADYWRRELYRAPAPIARRLLAAYGHPAALAGAVAPYVARPYLRLRAQEDATGFADDLASIEAGVRRMRELWRGERGAIEKILATHPGLNRRSYTSANVGRWCAAMATALEGDDPLAVGDLDVLHRFTPEGFAAKGRAGAGVPEHPFFALCVQHARLHAISYTWSMRLERRFLEFARAELALRKRAARRRSHDDVLLGVHAALAGANGEALARRLRGRYRAALIDEFQDTDPLQYGIFERLYGDGERLFVMVGDPKQAIYSFRGADVFAYLGAARGAETTALASNRRSVPALVGAFNALFGRGRRPFLLDDIRWEPAQPAARREPLSVAGDPPAPLVIMQLPEGTDGAATARSRAVPGLVRSVAAEVARLLELARAGQARIGARPLAASDIAVLVRTNAHAALVRAALRDAGVAAIEIARISVFASRAAADLELFLAAVAEPGRGAVVRAALGTAIAGLDATALAALAEDEAAWQRWSDRFHRWHGIWLAHGCARMLRTAMTDLGTVQRALAGTDGERYLTDLRHIAELSESAPSSGRRGMAGLLRWFAARRAEDGTPADEMQIRLETDAPLVKIVTVHRAKGLEYPIVLCPFLWDDASRPPGDGSFVWHDPQADNHAVLDMRCEEREIALARKAEEDFAESLRLFYVAATRAVHRCYVWWGYLNGAARSAAAWFLFGRPDEAGAAALEARVEGLGQAGRAEALRMLERDSAGTIALRAAPEAVPAVAGATEPAPVLAARTLLRAVPAPWRIASFTRLVADAGELLSVAPDHDATVRPPALPGGGEDMFGFPRGAAAGSCLHAIIEEVDFTRAGARELEAIAGRHLAQAGFEARWQPVVAAHLRRVLDTPLDATGLRLADVPRARRLDELEFRFSLGRVDAGALTQCLRALPVAEGGAYADACARLSFGSVHGYMRGFIDLLFEVQGRWYLADYKSNWLGAQREDYAAARLPAVMAREGYRFQYLIYLVALHRFLRARLPGYRYERHVAGVAYLFLRGMDPATGRDSGVFFDRPPRSVIEALDRRFLPDGR
ncbi:MAG: exodeoxyribonuclease V subunit beta [Gammaproteobacteria bacterium]